MKYFRESVKTLEAKWYVIWLARIFGKKFVGREGDYIVTIYQYRGVSYLTGFKKL